MWQHLKYKSANKTISQSSCINYIHWIRFSCRIYLNIWNWWIPPKYRRKKYMDPVTFKDILEIRIILLCLVLYISQFVIHLKDNTNAISLKCGQIHFSLERCQSTSSMHHRWPNDSPYYFPRLSGSFLPPWIRYIDPRLSPKVNISSNKGNRCWGRWAWNNFVRIGLRLGERSLQSTMTTLDMDTSHFTELPIPYHCCCSPKDSHQIVLHASPISKSHCLIITSL